MLWFKNLMVYRLSRDIELRAEEMEKQLAELTFTPCGSQDMAKTGWVSPMGSHSDALTHTANGQIIICARKEENDPAVAGDQAGAGGEDPEARSRSGAQAEED